MGPVMKFAIIVTLLFFIDVCTSASLQTKENEDQTLIFYKNVNLPGVPFKTRQKSINYNGKQVIKAIELNDLSGSTNSVVKVYNGGVGFTFVKMSLESEIGEPLQYEVKVFV